MDHSPENPPHREDGPGAELTESAELQSHFAALHERYATTADVPVGAALAEFIDVVDLTAPPTPARPTPTTRRTKVLTGIGAFVATTTGKIVLGTSVAAASVGGMHAAEIVDVPLLPERAEVVMVDEELEEVDAPVEDESEGEELAAEESEGDELVTTAPPEDDDEDADERDEDDDVVEEEDSDDEEAEDEDKNHGSVVSEFARTTELEGCERGQAVSELARSKPKKKDANEDDSDDESDVDEDDVADEEQTDEDDTDESKCKDNDEDGDEDDDERDDEDEDDGSDDDEDDEDDDDGEGPPEGKGHNRDDHPGQGNAGGSDD